MTLTRQQQIKKIIELNPNLTYVDLRTKNSSEIKKLYDDLITSSRVRTPLQTTQPQPTQLKTPKDKPQKPKPKRPTQTIPKPVKPTKLIDTTPQTQRTTQKDQSLIIDLNNLHELNKTQTKKIIDHLEKENLLKVSFNVKQIYPKK